MRDGLTNFLTTHDEDGNYYYRCGCVYSYPANCFTEFCDKHMKGRV